YSLPSLSSRFLTDAASTEIYTLSLHDALPIWMEIELVVFDMAGTTVHDGDAVGSCFRAALATAGVAAPADAVKAVMGLPKPQAVDRKSTRLNSRHLPISYALFCLEKKKKLVRS